MANLAHYLYDGYNYVVEDLACPLTKNWFLVGKPLNLIVVLGSYLYFCIHLGPFYMKDRKPYEIKSIIKIYNIFQIIASLYLFYEATVYVFFSDYNFYCQGLHDQNSAVGIRIANATWVFYIVKLIDLMDTLFFVLRKSNRQITHLHLHHHTLMIIAAWITVTYIPGGQTIIVGLINSLIHAVMYTYYLLSGLGEEYKKYLWWKKYLTTLQLVQFVIIGVHSINSLFYTCSYPDVLKYLVCIYAFVFIFMFGKFYYNNYVNPKNEKTKNDAANGKKSAESNVNTHKLKK